METAELSKLLENWELGKILSIKKAEKGEVNHNWFVESTKGKFILRQFKQDRELNEIMFEIEYLDSLIQNNFSYKIPTPLKTRNQKFVVLFKGKYYWLTSFIEGKVLDNFDETHLKELAKMVSEYHKILENFSTKTHGNPNDDLCIKAILIETKKRKSELSKKTKLNINDQVYLNEINKIEPILKSINTKEYSKLRKFPIHRDLNPENLLWNKNSLVGVIDFENVSSMSDAFIKDLAIIIQYACSDEDHKLDTAKSIYFLEEYQKHKKISKKEISLLPEILAAGFIEDFDYAYWMIKNDPSRAKPSRLKLYSSVAQWYWNNREEICNKLLSNLQ